MTAAVKSQVPRPRADERDFCACGEPLAGRGVRRCLIGHPEVRRLLLVRDIDGREDWLPVPHALARGGRP